jgi:uncharacterized protein (UPF0335 family)
MPKIAKRSSTDDDETPGIGHNSIGGVVGERLKSFVERIVRLEEDKKNLGEDVKEVYSEAKGVGFDVKILRKVVKRSQMEREKVREEDDLIDLYEAALAGLNEMME